MGNVYHGRTATLAACFESTYRTVPVTPDAQLLKFSTLEIGQEADLQDDPTINADALVEKRDEMDSTSSAKISAIFCLNDIGYWLKALLGAPTTTGAGPYTHTFTLTLADRPSMLLEASIGTGGDQRWFRHLGNVLNELSWDVKEANQSFNAALLGAVEVKPAPSAAVDATPRAVMPKRRACTRRANVYDVLNASTIGEISKCSISVKNDLEGQSLADGLEGFGRMLLGQPSITGSMSGLFTPGTLFDHGLSHASKKLVCVQSDETGAYSLTTTIPNIEFDRPKLNVASSKGLIIDGLGWRAHKVAGANPVTFVLVNETPSYN